ncbi:MAG TPA: TetR/AcrR family transcriptional regulator, partial [Polyangiales bacterium]|nr:TetR/AcrR family transcriptional regulator [Polyangiales bacterium]
MYTVKVAAGKARDAVRLMELLWRAPGQEARTRGPRPGLHVDHLVSTAVAIADELGIEQLTIRAVAKRLKVAPMSVYTYVPGKSELLLLMLDQVFTQMTVSSPTDDSWRARVRALADDNHRLYAEHPWLAELPPNRPPLGPGTLGKYERELSVFVGLQLSDLEIDLALTFVLSFVGSCAATTARARAEVSESAQTDAEWWTTQEPALMRVMQNIDQHYPLSSRVGAASAEAQNGTYDAETHYKFGLARVLD